jgi:SAM-dependent methyltransferase
VRGLAFARPRGGTSAVYSGDVEREEALVFGEVADLYEATRPGYPDALFDEVMASVARPRRVLKVGAGTGRATAVLAQRGVEVEAIEPDYRMAELARRRTAGLPVRVRELRFESWDGPANGFDLVVCAQAWHWIEPARGAAVAARALRPDGALAIWWNRPRAVAGPVLAAVRDAYRREAPALAEQTSLLVVGPGIDIPDELVGFGPWRTRTFRWSRAYDAASYAELIQTQGDHRLLGPDRLKALVVAVRAAIDDVGGGRIEYVFSADLSIARPA